MEDLTPEERVRLHLEETRDERGPAPAELSGDRQAGPPPGSPEERVRLHLERTQGTAPPREGRASDAPGKSDAAPASGSPEARVAAHLERDGQPPSGDGQAGPAPGSPEARIADHFGSQKSSGSEQPELFDRSNLFDPAPEERVQQAGEQNWQPLPADQVDMPWKEQGDAAAPPEKQDPDARLREALREIKGQNPLARKAPAAPEPAVAQSTSTRGAAQERRQAIRYGRAVEQIEQARQEGMRQVQDVLQTRQQLKAQAEALRAAADTLGPDSNETAVRAHNRRVRALRRRMKQYDEEAPKLLEEGRAKVQGALEKLNDPRFFPGEREDKTTWTTGLKRSYWQMQRGRALDKLVRGRPEPISPAAKNNPLFKPEPYTDEERAELAQEVARYTRQMRKLPRDPFVAAAQAEASDPENTQGEAATSALAQLERGGTGSMYNLVTSSSLQSLPTILTTSLGALAGSVAGPAGSRAGASAGAFIGSAPTEKRAALAQYLMEEGVDITDPQALGRALQGESGQRLAERVRTRAQKRGAGVGAVDAFFAAALPALANTNLSKVPRNVAGFASETAGEAGGELAGQALAGEDVRLGDAAIEAVAGAGQSAGTSVATQAASAGRGENAAGFAGEMQGLSEEDLIVRLREAESEPEAEAALDEMMRRREAERMTPSESASEQPVTEQPVTEETAAEEVSAETPAPEEVEPLPPKTTTPEVHVDEARPTTYGGTETQEITLRLTDPSRDPGPNPEASPQDEVGRIVAERKGGQLRISNSFVGREKDRGQGYGTQMYEALADYAAENDLTLVSDREVTPEAARMYDALRRRGYVVEQAESARLEDVEGEEKFVATGEPVFSVTGVPEQNQDGGSGALRATEDGGPPSGVAQTSASDETNASDSDAPFPGRPPSNNTASESEGLPGSAPGMLARAESNVQPEEFAARPSSESPETPDPTEDRVPARRTFAFETEAEAQQAVREAEAAVREAQVALDAKRESLEAPVASRAQTRAELFGQRIPEQAEGEELAEALEPERAALREAEAEVIRARSEAEAFRRQQPSSSPERTAPAEVQRRIETAVAPLTEAGLPRSRVVASPEALPTRQRQAFEEGRRAGQATPGVFAAGEGMLVASEIERAAEASGRTIEDQARATYLHEIAAHEGLRVLFESDGEFTTAMADLAGLIGTERLRTATPKGEATLFDLYMPEGVDALEDATLEQRAELAEEYLAHLAEGGLDLEQGIVRRVLDFLRRQATRLRRALGRAPTDAELKRVLEAAARGLRDRQSQNEGDARFSRTSAQGSFSEEGAVNRTGVPARIVEVEPEAFAGDTIEEARKNAEQWARENLQGKTFRNRDTGWQLRVSRSTISNTVYKRRESKERAALQVSANRQLPQLIQQAVLVHSHPDRQGRPSIARVHRFFVPIRTPDGEVLPVKLTAREYASEEPSATTRRKLHDLEVIGAEIDTELAVSQGRRPEGVVRPAASPVEMSLRDLAGPVSFDEQGRALDSSGDVRFSRQGTETPAEAAPVATDGFGQKAWSFLRRQFLSKGNLPGNVFEYKVEKEGAARAALRRVKYTLGDFDRAAQRAYGGEIPPADVRLLDDVLKGNADAAQLPAPMREVVTEMRQHIDALSDALIESGAVSGDLALTIEANKGTYVTRSYQVHDDPKWAEKVPEDVRNKAKAFLRKQNPDATEEEIQGTIEELLYDEDSSPFAALKSGKLGSKDLSITKTRKDIAEELRTLMGEYRDVRTNYVRSMAKMIQVVTNQRFLRQVKEDGLGTYLHEQSVVKGGVAYKAQIAAEGSKSLEPLNGLYTTPEIKAAFEGLAPRGEMHPATEMYYKALGFTKAAKTVYAPKTQVRNYLGNIAFAVGQGHWRAGEKKRAVKLIAQDLRNMGTDEQRAEYQKLLRLGVIDESVRAGEIEDVFADASFALEDETSFNDSKLTELAKKGARGAQKAYRIGDDAWKMYAFYNEKARYQKALPDLSESEIEQKAAAVVRNTYPTYSLVPRAAKLARRFPLAGTFVSFPAEIIRTSYHTLNQIKSDLADPRTRGVGLQRAAGTLIAGAAGTGAVTTTGGLAWWGVTAGLGALAGMTAEDDEKVRRFVAPWEKDSQLAYLKKSPGKIEFVDVGYLNPYGYLNEPVRALLRGENVDPMTRAQRAAWRVLEPFASEEILTQKLLDVGRNKTKTGGSVYNEEAPAPDIIADVVEHIYDGLEPGAISSGRRIYEGFQNKTEAYGTERDAGQEALSIITGSRIRTVDVRQSLYFNTLDYARRWRRAGQNFTTVAKRRGHVTEEELREGYRKKHQARRAILREAHGDVAAALHLGVPEEAVRTVIDDAGFAEEDVEHIVRGRYVPRVTGNPLSGRIEGAEAMGQENDAAELRRRREIMRKIQREGRKRALEGLPPEERRTIRSGDRRSSGSLPGMPSIPRPPRPPSLKELMREHE